MASLLAAERHAREERLTEARAGRKPKRLFVPMHPELEAALSKSAGANCSPDDFVFPSLAGKTGTGRSGLCMCFSRLMDRVGLDPAVRRQKTGKSGRSVRARTFHSLRHSFVSLLGNAGLSLEHRQLLVGHAEESMTKGYAHTGIEALRGAVDRLPGLPDPEE